MHSNLQSRDKETIIKPRVKKKGGKRKKKEEGNNTDKEGKEETERYYSSAWQVSELALSSGYLQKKPNDREIPETRWRN